MQSEDRYRALRENVNLLCPIQLGVALAGTDGVLCGVWSFNLRFDASVDLHTEASVAFLRSAGLHLSRHASEGINGVLLGRRLAASSLFSRSRADFPPLWVTFSGTYDLGFLFKLVTAGRPLPLTSDAFSEALVHLCPRRHDLRDSLPRGSLDSLASIHQVQRHGRAHTAGSDALLTLELYLHVVRVNRDIGDSGLWHWSGWDGNWGPALASPIHDDWRWVVGTAGCWGPPSLWPGSYSSPSPLWVPPQAAAPAAEDDEFVTTYEAKLAALAEQAVLRKRSVDPFPKQEPTPAIIPQGPAETAESAPPPRAPLLSPPPLVSFSVISLLSIVLYPPSCLSLLFVLLLFLLLVLLTVHFVRPLPRPLISACLIGCGVRFGAAVFTNILLGEARLRSTP